MGDRFAPLKAAASKLSFLRHAQDEPKRRGAGRSISRPVALEIDLVEDASLPLVAQRDRFGHAIGSIFLKAEIGYLTP